MAGPSRLLAVLGLCLALTGVTAVAVAQPSQPTTDDLNEQRKALYESELEPNLQRSQSGHTGAVEDHYDRWLRIRRAEEARGAQAGAEPTEAERRRIARVPEPYGPAPVPAAPAAKADPTPAATDVDVLATLLLGLVGGVVGGVAALAGWAATTRRRPRQPASAT